MQGNIYGFVSCWHHRKRLKMAKGVLAGDECLSGGVREPQYSLLAVGTS